VSGAGVGFLEPRPIAILPLHGMGALPRSQPLKLPIHAGNAAFVGGGPGRVLQDRARWSSDHTDRREWNRSGAAILGHRTTSVPNWHIPQLEELCIRGSQTSMSVVAGEAPDG
jgi:hypothetical protein